MQAKRVMIRWRKKKRNCWRQIIIKETEGGNNVDVLRGRVLAVLCLDTRIMLHNIVFRSGMVAGPVQDLDSGFWPDQFFFKKIQNDVVLIKKTKVNGL